MNQWLTDFAYRSDISWWMFALAGRGYSATDGEFPECEGRVDESRKIVTVRIT